MQEQTQEREERLLSTRAGQRRPAAVGRGRGSSRGGNRKLFESLAGRCPISIVEGGQTMKTPRTADNLRACQCSTRNKRSPYRNNRTSFGGRARAANADRTVEVPFGDVDPGGLGAMVAFEGCAHAAENAAEMREAVAAVGPRGDDLASATCR